jgi:hypothetical protein
MRSIIRAHRRTVGLVPCLSSQDGANEGLSHSRLSLRIAIILSPPSYGGSRPSPALAGRDKRGTWTFAAFAANVHYFEPTVIRWVLPLARSCRTGPTRVSSHLRLSLQTVDVLSPPLYSGSRPSPALAGRDERSPWTFAAFAANSLTLSPSSYGWPRPSSVLAGRDERGPSFCAHRRTVRTFVAFAANSHHFEPTVVRWALPLAHPCRMEAREGHYFEPAAMRWVLSLAYPRRTRLARVSRRLRHLMQAAATASPPSYSELRLLLVLSGRCPQGPIF